MTPGELRVRALSGLPAIRPGDDLAELLAAAIVRSGESLRDGDVVVVAQKIVSKAEGRRVRLSDVVPSPRAVELAARTDKDPRAVEVILGESVEVVRAVPGVLIVETRHGIVLANAGADMSNIEHDEEDDHLLLLPEDPDASADRLRAGLAYRMQMQAACTVGTDALAGTDTGIGRNAATGFGETSPPADEAPDAPSGADRGTLLGEIVATSAGSSGGSRPGTVEGTPAAFDGEAPRFGVIVADSVGSSVMRMTRSQMLEVIREDYIRTALAKGLARRAVVVRHALRNAILPVLTQFGGLFSVTILGLVITETLFHIPGMGKSMVDAISNRDYPVIQGFVLVNVFIVMVINLTVDLLYSVVDPRIRFA